MDACGKRDIPPIVKLSAAFKTLAYGSAGHEKTRYLKISETTVFKCVNRFCKAMVEIYKDSIIRYPTHEQAQTLSDIYGVKGFPGCIGCIDCAGWVWKICPSALAGLYTGRSGKPTVTMETICDSSLQV